mmetsp:Transcript_3335/g.10151  ORF Transcript_3335/g.10151 Transcript_3335/m.10151 type:complete len:326 (-) Transcript_3335:933-1910(-)
MDRGRRQTSAQTHRERHLHRLEETRRPVPRQDRGQLHVPVAKGPHSRAYQGSVDQGRRLQSHRTRPNPRPEEVVSHREPSSRPYRQAVPRALAQPSQPLYQEVALDRGGGRHHFRRPAPNGQPLGRDRQAPPWADRQRYQKPLELIHEAQSGRSGTEEDALQSCARLSQRCQAPRLAATSRASQGHPCLTCRVAGRAPTNQARWIRFRSAPSVPFSCRAPALPGRAPRPKHRPSARDPDHSLGLAGGQPHRKPEPQDQVSSAQDSNYQLVHAGRRPERVSPPLSCQQCARLQRRTVRRKQPALRQQQLFTGCIRRWPWPFRRPSP